MTWFSRSCFLPPFHTPMIMMVLELAFVRLNMVVVMAVELALVRLKLVVVMAVEWLDLVELMVQVVVNLFVK